MSRPAPPRTLGWLLVALAPGRPGAGGGQVPGASRAGCGQLARQRHLCRRPGGFLYLGVMDPLGGGNSLWPTFGVANQLLAVIACALGTTVLIKMGKASCIWVILAPRAWLMIVTLTAGWLKIFSPAPRPGFLSKATRLASHISAGVPTSELAAWKSQITAAATAVFLLLVIQVAGA